MNNKKKQLRLTFLIDGSASMHKHRHALISLMEAFIQKINENSLNAYFDEKIEFILFTDKLNLYEVPMQDFSVDSLRNFLKQSYAVKSFILPALLHVTTSKGPIFLNILTDGFFNERLLSYVNFDWMTESVSTNVYLFYDDAIGVRPDIYYSMTHFLRLCPKVENTLNLISRCSKFQEDIQTALTAILKHYNVSQEEKQDTFISEKESKQISRFFDHVCDPLELIIGNEVFVKAEGYSYNYLLGTVVTQNSPSTFIISFDEFNKYSKTFVEVQKQIDYSEMISAMELKRHEIRQLDFVLCQLYDERLKMLVNEYKIGRVIRANQRISNDIITCYPNNSEGYESLLVNFGESVVRKSTSICYWFPQEMVKPEIYVKLGQGHSELRTKDKKLCFEFDREKISYGETNQPQQKIPFTYTLDDLNSERLHFSGRDLTPRESEKVKKELPKSKSEASLAAIYRELRDNWTETEAKDFLHSLGSYKDKRRNKNNNVFISEVKPPWRYWGSKPIPNAISEEIIFDVFRDSVDFRNYDQPREESILINGEGESFKKLFMKISGNEFDTLCDSEQSHEIAEAFSRFKCCEKYFDRT